MPEMNLTDFKTKKPIKVEYSGTTHIDISQSENGATKLILLDEINNETIYYVKETSAQVLRLQIIGLY